MAYRHKTWTDKPGFHYFYVPTDFCWRITNTNTNTLVSEKFKSIDECRQYIKEYKNETNN